MAANRKLRDANRRHLEPTLRLLAAHSLTEDRDDEHPAGWVPASNVWLRDHTGLSRPTVTAHIRGLIDSGELVLWSPESGRNGREREFLVRHLTTRRSLIEAVGREYDRNHDPIRSKAQQGKYWGKSTIPPEPLNALGPNRAETPESRETVTQQGPAGKVSESPLLVPARHSGTKTTGPNNRDNTEREPVDPVPSIAVPATRFRSWSELIAHASSTTFKSQNRTGNHRGEHVGLGRCLDRVAIEQGPEAAGAVFGRAVTRTHRGEGLTTALRDELKIALAVNDWDSEWEFAATCADHTIPRTTPNIPGWPNATTIHQQETGT